MALFHYTAILSISVNELEYMREVNKFKIYTRKRAKALDSGLLLSFEPIEF